MSFRGGGGRGGAKFEAEGREQAPCPPVMGSGGVLEDPQRDRDRALAENTFWTY